MAEGYSGGRYLVTPYGRLHDQASSEERCNLDYHRAKVPGRKRLTFERREDVPRFLGQHRRPIVPCKWCRP